MITQWNDAEDDALQGLPLRAQIIYLRGIRRYMNYKTGICGGPERRICLKGLGEVSEAYFNRQREQPNKKEVIVSIEQLKKAGLLERIEDKDYLVFFLPKADVNKSVQINHGTTTAQPWHNNGTNHGTDEASNDEALSGNHGIGENSELLPPTGTTAHNGLSDKQITDVLKEKDVPPEEPKAFKFVLPDWVNKEKWDLWMKTRKGKKMVPEQKQAQVEKLETWKIMGLDHAQALSDAAAAGWQGLFEPKQKSPNSATNRNPGFKQPMQRPDYSELWEGDAIDSTVTGITYEH